MILQLQFGERQTEWFKRYLFIIKCNRRFIAVRNQVVINDRTERIFVVYAKRLHVHVLDIIFFVFEQALQRIIQDLLNEILVSWNIIQ